MQTWAHFCGDSQYLEDDRSSGSHWSAMKTYDPGLLGMASTKVGWEKKVNAFSKSEPPGQGLPRLCQSPSGSLQPYKCSQYATQISRGRGAGSFPGRRRLKRVLAGINLTHFCSSFGFYHDRHYVSQKVRKLFARADSHKRC